MEGERGAASVEHVALAILIALLLLAGIAALAASGDLRGGRELAGTIGRRLACGPRLPDDCRHHPLVPAYGWSIARVVRAFAPAPAGIPGPDGSILVPVDFRRCRRASCAVPGPDPAHLTASNRRTTAFTSVIDRRDSLGWVEISYWLYRPTLGWEKVVRRADAVAFEIASSMPVLQSQDPALVPLETLPGRNHYEFPPGERPPWRWRVGGSYPGWSS